MSNPFDLHGAPYGRQLIMSVAFDTLACTKKLKEAGFTENQAEAQAEALVDALRDNIGRLVTQQDLRVEIQDVRQEIQFFRQEMKEEFQVVRQEMKKEIQTVRQALKEEVQTLRRETTAATGTVKVDHAIVKT